jgi:uncharacterized membrane protein
MTNYPWKAKSAEYAIKIDSFYAKNISLAWINWELSQLAERTQIQRRRSKK